MRIRTTAIIALMTLAVCGCKTPQGAVADEPGEDAVSETTDESNSEETSTDETSTDETSTDESDTDESNTDEKHEDTDDSEGSAKPTTFVPEPTLPKKLGLQEMALARTAEQKLAARRSSPIVFYPKIDTSGDDQCAESTGASAGLSYESGESYTLDECRRAVDAMHAKTYTRHVTRFGATDISFVAIRHNGEDLWSAADPCEEMSSGTHCATDFVEGRAEVLSLVGPIVTIDLTWSDAGGGGPPYHGQDQFTFDTRTGKLATFDALVTADSLLNALKRDSHLRTAVNPTELDAAESLDELWDLWRTEDFAHFGSYYFHAWDAENERVAMRIAFLEETAGLDENSLSELGLWVKPKKQFLPAFEAAASGDGGFYASD